MSVESLPAQLRVADPARYLCALHAPAAARPAIMALALFNTTLAMVRSSASEPLLAQMRLTWWHEAIEQLYAGKARAHEALQALDQTSITSCVPEALLHQMIEAREAECSGTPPATLAETAAIAQESAGTLAKAMCHAIRPHPGDTTLDAAAQSGTAFALAAMAASVMVHAQQGWRFVPDDALISAGLKPTLDTLPDARWRPAIAAVATRAAALAAPQLAPDPAFASVLAVRVLARDLIARLASAGHDPRRAITPHYGALAQLRLLMAVTGKRC